MSSIESALVILVPEAEALVKPFRDRYDPSAAAGMPAHITLLYPFKPPDEIGDAVLDQLRHGFSRFEPFRFSLISIRRVPAEVMYLAPEPDQPFRRLISAIWGWFPETPPYGGQWLDIVPHLTVANVADEPRLAGIADEFAEASKTILPIGVFAADVALLDNRSGRWQLRARFGLKPA